MVVAATGEVEKIKALLNAGVAPYDVDQDGLTALMYAAEAAGNSETIELLLRAGVDINAKDFHGKTALRYAREKKRQDIMDQLRKAGGIE